MNWQIQETKQRFSEVLRAAEAGESVSFMDYLRVDPAADAEFDVERRPDLPREIDLAG